MQDKKFRKTVYLDIDIVKKIKIISVEKGISESEVINSILKKELNLKCSK